MAPIVVPPDFSPVKLHTVKSSRGGAAALLLVLWLSSLASPAWAADSSQAHKRYEQGAAAYNLGRFDEAIAAFSDAYERDHAPILLFNIAQAHWKKGDSERALFFYRRYLEADPQARNRPQVDARIRALENQLAAAAPVAEARAPLPPVLRPTAAAAQSPIEISSRPAPREPAQPLLRRPWLWGAVGVVVIGAAAAVVAVMASHKEPWACSSCGLGQVNVPGGK
jgi:tetratricopeptide (TPR) repeat protein